MKLRLHEIELGTSNVSETTHIYQAILGLQLNVQQKDLSVFDAGVKGLDLNVSKHILPGVTVISFLTDDLSEIERRLTEAGIAFKGPFASHLGMTSLSFQSPDGLIIKVNTRGPESPGWLQV